MKSRSFRDRKRAAKEKKNPLSQNLEITDSSLLMEIHEAKKDIDTILLHLDYQTDPDLIDCYAYQLKSAYMRYKFLLKQVQGEAS